MNKVRKVRVKKGIITLTDKDYKAAGGQGVVYCKDGLAYKIYHDPSTMIPVAKIQELSILKRDTILGPIEPLYDIASTSDPIGFTMCYVDGTEFLCKVFTKTFRTDKGMSPQDMVELVTDMQKTLEYVHSNKILVVDYNEMNFLLDKDLKRVYYIDVDPWTTPSFPKATVIMESVKDPKCKGHFSELSDWFSFAVVTFQMYVGIHPYKGFHPKFSPADWQKRMSQGISVFDKDVQLPASCQDFSVIPKKHLDWYKELFVKGDRSAPPYADILSVAVPFKIVTSKGQFTVELVHDFKTPIRKLYFFDGTRYAITSDGIYKNDDKINFAKGWDELCEVYGESPVAVDFSKGKIGFYDTKHDFKYEIGSAEASALMAANGLIYTVNNGDLIENSFERLGKLVHRTNVVSSLCPSFRVFPGMIVQDDFMKCHLAIPYKKGLCANINVKELDSYRIIDAKHEDRLCVLIAEKGGTYYRYILYFNDSFSKYDLKEEEVDLQAVNFVSLPNGINILADDENIKLFRDMKTRKEIKNSPVDDSTRLYHDGVTVYFVDDSRLYKIKMS